MADSTTFISYAREDIEAARRLYNELNRAGLKVWLDKESLLPGQKWEVEVRKAIEASRYFVALMSSHSVRKKGYVQREVVRALEILEEHPESAIYLIPARLDDCEPSHQKLRALHWVDMFPNWNDGLDKILLSVRLDSQSLESVREKLLKSTSVLPKEIADLESKRNELFHGIRAFAPPDLAPEELYKSAESFRPELDSLLADSSLTVEDKITLMLMLIMKKLDQQIAQAQLANSIRDSSPASDVERLKLKRLIDKRSQMFDMLRQVIDKHNQTAKGIIDSMGR